METLGCVYDLDLGEVAKFHDLRHQLLLISDLLP